MGTKRRNRGSHSKQSNAKSSDHTKGDTEKPMEKKSNQTKGTNEKNKVRDEYKAITNLLGGIPESFHKRVRTYWKNLSIDLKKEFLKIRVKDLIYQFGTPETGLGEFIRKVVSFVRAGKSWMVWICLPCSEWYADLGSYMLHVWEEHVGCLPEEFFPETVDDEWIEDFNDCCWEPLDASAAINMLEKQAKSLEASIPKAYCWPLSNDSERAKLLQMIQRELKLLIGHNYFGTSNLSWLMKFAEDKISGLANGSLILNHTLDQSPYCICFLGVPELKEIYRYLLGLINACGLVISGDKGTDLPDDICNLNRIPVIKEEILLNKDASCLLLDERLLLAPGTIESATVNDVINNKDPFLSWILLDSCLKQWAVWHRRKSNNMVQQKNLLKALQTEVDKQKECWITSDAVTNYDEGLQVVEDLCLEEGIKRKNFTESVQQSYESVLRMRIEELSKSEEHVSNTFELDAITNVLEQAQLINANQSGYEKNSTGACDLESQMDSFIRTAIEQQKGIQLNKLAKIDERILIGIAEVKRLQLKLSFASTHDLREPFLPLMKTYLKTRLDDLAAQYGKEALLDGLAAKSENGARGGSDSAKHKEKTKTMKKNKENRKTKTMNLKVGSITNEEQRHVLDTTTADFYSAAPGKKKHLAERLKEIEFRKKSLAEQKKELEEEEEVRLTVEIEEMKEKLSEKQKHLTNQQIKLGDEEGRFRIEIQEKKAKLAKKQTQLTHQQKELRDEEERLRIEIQEKKAKLAKKQTQLAHQQKELGDEGGRHRIEIQEKKAKLEKKRTQIAHQKKELGEEEEWLGYEIEEKRAKLEEKHTHLAQQQKELEEEEETTKIELEKQDDKLLTQLNRF